MNRSYAATAPRRLVATPDQRRVALAATAVAAITLASAIVLGLATVAMPAAEQGLPVTDGWLHSGVATVDQADVLTDGWLHSRLTTAAMEPADIVTDGWLHSTPGRHGEAATTVTDGWLHSSTRTAVAPAAGSD